MSRLILIVFLTLAACASFEETCQGYGFSPGTTAYAQCLQNENLGMRQRLAILARQ